MGSARVAKWRESFLFLLVVVLGVTNLFLGYLLYVEKSSVGSEKNVGGVGGGGAFNLLAPSVALGDEEFWHKKVKFVPSYLELKERVNDSFYFSVKKYANSSASFGFYFEDLDTGAWVGINERDTFIPGSLLKIPTLVAVLKKVENGELSLDRRVMVLGQDLDSNYGPLAYWGCGYNLSVFELINYTIYYSDNTANNALFRQIEIGDFFDSLTNLGVSTRSYIMSGSILMLSPKDESNIFRNLYYSGYLERNNSQLLLQLLASTNFTGGLPAGVPEGVVVSHKTGQWRDYGEYHDCGIVYAPKKRYMICVMTRGITEDESARIIGEISHVTYDFISSYS
jgi:beta-lactamase class A